MNQDVIVALLSGQLLLVAWTIFKEIRQHQAHKKAMADQEHLSDAQLRSMVFRLYRNSMEEKIVQTYHKVDDDAQDLRASLMALKDDMECYTEAGGNGIIHDMYVRLSNHVREKKGEGYYVLLVIDEVHAKN